MPPDAVARYLVRGRVQGVGFRWFVSGRLRALGARGWIRNLPDGSVEAVVGGSAEVLARARTLLGQGPPGAEVAQVVEVPLLDGGSLPCPFRIE